MTAVQGLPRMRAVGTATLSPHTIVKRVEGVPFSRLDDELLAIDVQQGFLYSLNETGGCVWDAIAAPISVGDVCRGLAASYEVDATACQQDVIRLLGHLCDAGLVEVVDGSR